MEIIGQWAFSLCIAAILCSVILLLSPSKKLEKGMRLACVLLFVLCFCAPLGKFDLQPASLNISEQENAYITPQQSLCNGMEFLITSLLRENGIRPKCVSVSADPDGTLHAAVSLSDSAQLQHAVLLIETTYEIQATGMEE